MRRKKRGYVWVSLMLMCGLCVPRQEIIWANEEANELKTELSGNETPDEEEMRLERENTVYNDEYILSENSEEDIDGKETVRDGGASSDNESGTEDSLSENEVLTISSQDSPSTVSDDGSEDEEHEDIFRVSLPTDIPFGITLLGKERRKGMIRSEQFCIENNGYEDMIISFNGVCSGEGGEKYTTSDTSVKDKTVQEKTVWMYLKWEDKDGKELDQTGITIGDAENPGEGDILLKAPTRDGNGAIIEDDTGSKIYFSFTGDLNAGENGAWKGDELRISLEYSITNILSTNMAAYEANRDKEGYLSVDAEVSDQPVEDNENLDTISGDDIWISGNSDIADVPENIIDVSDDNADDMEIISGDLATDKEEDIPHQ